MATLYVEVSERGESAFGVSLETLVALHILKICDSNTENVRLKIVVIDLDLPLVSVNLSQFSYDLVEEIPALASCCIWPVVVVGSTAIAGLASVSRQLIKSSMNPRIKHLLGFREACLLACSETSLWTEFCEIDMIRTTKSIIADLNKYCDKDEVRLPKDVSRFECHLAYPIRIHNIYKFARQKNRDRLITSSLPVEQLNLSHTFAEGPYCTLSDMLLFPCYEILFATFGCEAFSSAIPLTVAWFKNLQNEVMQQRLVFETNQKAEYSKDLEVIQENIEKLSLYSSKPANRIYTKQEDIEKSLETLSRMLQSVFNPKKPFGFETHFDWAEIPLDLNPLGGALPKSRANRKCEQLENLAKATIKLVGSNRYTIVDFCSGSGHLGILIAFLLPDSKLILVENKERSLLRAKQRIEKLGLTNVSLVQSNLGYFKGDFDVGIALHACGVATDLVLQTCIKNRAHFVCCPCCYGGIHGCHSISYPRSKAFKTANVEYRDYLVVAHAADQTHDERNAKTQQGFACMDMVDTDRKLQAEESGYEVYLGKLIPPSCTPKNNLLVGLCKEK